MTIYWTSTRAPIHLFKRDYETAELAKHVTENACIDAAILAAEVGLQVDTVKAYQRRLGVRKIAENNPLPKQQWGRARGMSSALRDAGDNQ